MHAESGPRMALASTPLFMSAGCVSQDWALRAVLPPLPALRTGAAAAEPACFAGPNLAHFQPEKKGQTPRGLTQFFLFGSGGSLCTLAMSPEPLAVMKVRLVVA